MPNLPLRNCSSAACLPRPRGRRARSGWPRDLAHDAAHGARNRRRSAPASAFSRGCRSRPACARRPALAGIGQHAVDVCRGACCRAAPTAKTSGAGCFARAASITAARVGIGQAGIEHAEYRRRPAERGLGGGSIGRLEFDRNRRHAPRPPPQLLLRRRGRNHQHAERNKIAAHVPVLPIAANPAGQGCRVTADNTRAGFQFIENRDE